MSLQRHETEYFKVMRNTKQGYNVGFSGLFFLILELIVFFFVVAICDLVHGAEDLFHPP